MFVCIEETLTKPENTLNLKSNYQKEFLVSSKTRD